MVLLFGDDYQLLPVNQVGAITGLANRLNLYDKPPKAKPRDQQLLINTGNDLFIKDLTENVFQLSTNYRSIGDPVFAELLNDMRPGTPSQENAERLVRQSLHFHDSTDPEFRKFIENHPKTVFLYATKDEKRAKNEEKLVQLSGESNNPVARLKCEWRSERNRGEGYNSIYKTHFNSSNIQYGGVDLCVGATVAIQGRNIVPEAGLYNGARGTIIDFIYDSVCGPNNKQGAHLPRAVIVDFPGLKLGNAKPWDKQNPTVSQGNPRLWDVFH